MLQPPQHSFANKTCEDIHHNAVDEQNEIKDCLIEIEKKSMKLQENLQNKVQLLEEYRQSLIFSVVTGKIQIKEDML